RELIKAIRRDPDRREDPPRPLHCVVLIRIGFMRANQLKKMMTNRHQRIQTSHRILENEGGVPSADLPQRGFLGRHEIEPCKSNEACDGCAICENAQDYRVEGALAACALLF